MPPSKAQAYLNGQFVPSEEAVVRVNDAGFVLGATVAERLRTFGGRLFKTREHLSRLARSLEIIGVKPGESLDELSERAEQLVAHNHPLGEPGDDLSLVIFVTPGPLSSLAVAARPRPTVCMHTSPLPFGTWVDKYSQGTGLVTTGIGQVPGECWPAELKCRSRVHYYLADREAEADDPGAAALLLDREGNVTETSIANLLVWRESEGLVSPPAETILPGITLATVAELAAKLDIPLQYRAISADELVHADELLLASTPYCLLPVTRFNRWPVGDGGPGHTFRRLLSAFGELVGVDIEQQATMFADRTH